MVNKFTVISFVFLIVGLVGCSKTDTAAPTAQPSADLEVSKSNCAAKSIEALPADSREGFKAQCVKKFSGYTYETPKKW